MPESKSSQLVKIYDLIANNFSAYRIEEMFRTIEYPLFLEPSFEDEGDCLRVDWSDIEGNIHSDRHEWSLIKRYGLQKDSGLSTSQHIDEFLRQNRSLL